MLGRESSAWFFHFYAGEVCAGAAIMGLATIRERVAGKIDRRFLNGPFDLAWSG